MATLVFSMTFYTRLIYMATKSLFSMKLDRENQPNPKKVDCAAVSLVKSPVVLDDITILKKEMLHLQVVSVLKIVAQWRLHSRCYR